MPSRICKSFRTIISLGILSFLAARGETVPVLPLPTLSISRMVGDLDNKEKSLSTELVSASLTSQKKEVKPEDSKKIAIRMSAVAEIGQCLSLRKSLAANPVVPTDPLYRVYQKRNLLELDLQTATTWWKYCKNESNSPTLGKFEEWPLVAQLKSDLDKANAELAALWPGKDTEPTPSIGMEEHIKLNPSLTGQLGDEKSKRPSVLDQIGGWEKLPEAQKSKFIVR